MSPSTIEGPLSDPTEDELATGAWRLDEAHSTASFEVPNLWGAIRVKGHFARFDGTLDLSAEPAVELSVDAASIDTANAKRDKHLRSGDFFAVERHPDSRSALLEANISPHSPALAATVRRRRVRPRPARDAAIASHERGCGRPVADG